MDIEIKEAEMRQVIANLEKEIAKLEEIYADIRNHTNRIDGSAGLWKGTTQDKVHNHYKEVESEFPDTVERIKSFKTFLETTLENYINGENSINKDVDTNKENLSINE